MYLSFSFFSLEARLEILAASFFVTMSIYTLNKKTDKEEDAINMPERKKFAESKAIVPLSLFSYAAAITLGGVERRIFILVLLVPLFAGFVYSIKIGGIRLKDIFLMKNTIIAISCASVAIMPFFYSLDYIKLLFIYSFFFMKLFLNTVVFDMRDVEGDRVNNIRTIPVRLGIERTKRILHIINISIFLLIIAGALHGIFAKYLPVLLFSIMYAHLYIHFSDRMPKGAYDFVVDGEWIYLATMVFAFNNFIY